MCAALGVAGGAPSVRAQGPQQGQPPTLAAEPEDEPALPALPVSTGNRYYDQLLNARSEPPPVAGSAAAGASRAAPAPSPLPPFTGAAVGDPAASAPASLRDALLREGADFAQQQRAAQAAREAAQATTAGRAAVQTTAWTGSTPATAADADDRFDLRTLLRALQAHRYEVLAGLLLVLLLALGLSSRHHRRQRRRAREAASRTVAWPGGRAPRSGRHRGARR